MFDLQGNGTTIRKELGAGLSSFVAMAYVTFVNPSILEVAGMNFGAVMVASILVTFLSCFIMGLFANYPFCTAPGIGVSAFIAFTVVPVMGATWQEALMATFIASLIVLILALFHIRRKILMSIPRTLFHGIATGIGLFLMVVALEKIGTLVDSGAGYVHYGSIWTAGALFTAVSLIVLFILFRFGIESAFFWVIIGNWGLAVLFGMTEWKGVFALPPSIDPTLFKLSFPKSFSVHYLVIIFSIFLIALFDSTCGLMILAKQGKFLKDGHLPRIQKAVLPDAFVSALCPLLGNSNLAFHLESMAGIHYGGRTGLTAIVCGLLFLLCLFLYPLISTIPAFATAPILIYIGFNMCKELWEVEWKRVSEWIPFLVTALAMPITFSIYNGFSYGFISYCLVKLLFGKWREIHLITAIFSTLFVLQLIYSLATH